ncbi:unnamed protein product [Urochloa humidicola]
MMQRRWQHGSSGELDVFGATSYFAGGLPDDSPPSKPAERLIQESKVRHVTSMEDEQLGLHADEGHAQLGRVANKPTGKSKLAALLMSFVVSPSARASFRKESPPPPEASNKTMLAASDESSSLSSRESSVQGCGGVHELDLGVAMGDRRLQGVRIVRGSGEERWVVRCSAWEEEHPDRMLDAAESKKSNDANKDEVEEGDNGNPAGGWESDCSSDLFDLDIEYMS